MVPRIEGGEAFIDTVGPRDEETKLNQIEEKRMSLWHLQRLHLESKASRVRKGECQNTRSEYCAGEAEKLDLHHRS